MTITVPEELARLAQTAGVSIEVYVERLAQQAIRPPLGKQEASTRIARAGNLVELAAPLRGLLTDQEVDALFTRIPSVSRPVDLS